MAQALFRSAGRPCRMGHAFHSKAPIRQWSAILPSQMCTLKEYRLTSHLPALAIRLCRVGGLTSAGMPLTRSCSQEEMAMASVTGVPANMPGVAKKLLGPRRTGEGVDMPCWFMGRRGDGIRRRGVPITAPSDLHSVASNR